MISNDDVVYSPLAFGYVNYSIGNHQNHFLKYAGIPGKTGALLGGAGIAVSSKCKNVNAAIEYIKWICGPEYQKSKYVEEGGQPGQLDAWKMLSQTIFFQIPYQLLKLLMCDPECRAGLNSRNTLEMLYMIFYCIIKMLK